MALTTAARRRSISQVGVVAVSELVRRRPIMLIGTLLAHRVLSDCLLSSEEASDEEEPAAPDEAPSAPSRGVEEPMSGAMIAAIGVYKNFISPLLPPACRFLPTCSQYGVQAIREFGPCRGALLTGWRLLRCSPIGGRGYDPPRWPPVPYGYGSY